MLEPGKEMNLSTVRKQTTKIVQEACNANEPVLVEAPPNSGKTTSAIKLAKQAERPVTYLAGRIDLYEQAEEWCEDQDDIRYERIPAPQRSCETFKGNTEASVEAVERLYAKGYSGRHIHLRFPEKMPCGKSCEYFQAMERIDKEIESIDFLIGHHSHCNRQQYVEDRIVIIDEFNPEPFLRSFPNKSSGVVDDPGEIIPEFLSTVATRDDEFPIETYQDITDLLQNRDGPTEGTAAIEWFQTHKADRFSTQQSEFVEPSLEPYNRAHTYTPLLVFSLLCMERIGPGIELAPPLDGHLDEVWEDAGLSPTTKCLRDRNTGEMYVLEPPDLSSAAQVIGLDGTPTVELWNLLFAPESGFNHEQVLSRDDFTTYLRSAMNMSLIQIGDGDHPYAGGNLSDLDRDRFAAIQALEGEEFSLVSTKKALEQYRSEGMLDSFVKQSPVQDAEADSNRVSGDHQALHYGTVKSSNDFEEESLGVVAGMPHPGDDLIQLWTGFCGESVELAEHDDTAEASSLGELGEKIYQHFAHNQVVQSVLRFGRDKSVYDDEGANVYISTYALPEWFDVGTEYNIRSKTKESAVLAVLFEIYHDEDQVSHAFRTVRQIYDAVEEDNRYPNISERGVRNALDRLSSKEYISVREDAGKYAADLYRWNGNGNGQILCSRDGRQFLKAGNDIYALTVETELNIQS
jgi:hypothetical protein